MPDNAMKIGHIEQSSHAIQMCPRAFLVLASKLKTREQDYNTEQYLIFGVSKGAVVECCQCN